MSAESLAREHYRGRGRLSDAISRLARQIWGRIDPGDLDTSWARFGPELVVGVAGAQLAAAGAAEGYLEAELNAQGVTSGADLTMNPSALAGIASDGRPLDSLLLNAITTVKSGIASGLPPAAAMVGGYANLDMLVRTQVADAGRAADQVALVGNRVTTGYVRMVQAGACGRCVVLAGKFYRWNAGFLRHPSCHCTHVPAAEDRHDDIRTDPRAWFESLSKAEQDKAFTKAGAQAIRDGADIGQVVNARRGAYGLAPAGARITKAEAELLGRGRLATQDVFGRQLFTTTEGATTRGTAGRSLGARDNGVHLAGNRYRTARPPRLMPESIYQIAGNDRAEAIRLLERNGYLRRTAPRPRRVPVEPPRPKLSPEAARFQLSLDGIEDLAERVENQLGLARRSGIFEGVQGEKKKLRWPDGVRLFSKSYAPDVSMFGAAKVRFVTDAEQLAAAMGRALGVNVPRVYRRDEYGIFTDWVTDAPQFDVEKRAGGVELAGRAVRSDEGVRIGLLDMLTGNFDRHSGNVLIGEDGTITAIDQGLAWSGALERLAHETGTGFAADSSVSMLGPAKVHFVDASRIEGLSDNPLTAEDIVWIRQRMSSLRELFDHLGRGRFLDYSHAVLDLLERHAKGTRRIFGD